MEPEQRDVSCGLSSAERSAAGLNASGGSRAHKAKDQTLTRFLCSVTHVDGDSTTDSVQKLRPPLLEMVHRTCGKSSCHKYVGVRLLTDEKQINFPPRRSSADEFPKCFYASVY